MADRSTTGMPLLNTSCRKCNKEFNIVFTRARRCNHCGFSYCSLMPRDGPSAGFDPVPVCAFCIENLTITAGGRAYLRNISLARLKKYVDAYNIRADGVLEKDDLIERIIAARTRGLFSRREESQPIQPTPPRESPSNPSSDFPRPDLDPSRQRRATPYSHVPAQSQYSPRTQSYPNPRPTSPPMAAPRAQHTTSNNVNPPQPPPDTARTPGQGNSTDNSTARPPSAASPPSLDELLAMTDDEISHMSISALKTVLFQNHSDLVARVRALLGDERHERAREAAIHAREEEEINARQHAMKEEQRHREEQARQDRAQDHSVHTPGNDARHPEPKISAPPILGTSADLERNGLCVVCQDEEANIAIVDCGHLAMCRHCSDLIMSSSRECPLCRTRIVTDARLLRIFKS
ncbi:hypothetical protein BJV77DRAFT_1061968 [Russula vinacea]|nr:hypothetical protein BJV77DRAFT_1061968 [Russula vinacea]